MNLDMAARGRLGSAALAQKRNNRITAERAVLNALTTGFLNAPGAPELGKLLEVRARHRDTGHSIPCDTDPDRWTVSGKYTPGDSGRATDKAARLCAACPLAVHAACDAYGTASGDQHSILGGIHPSQREPVTTPTDDIDHIAVARAVNGTPPPPGALTRNEILTVITKMLPAGWTHAEIGARVGRTGETIGKMIHEHHLAPQ